MRKILTISAIIVSLLFAQGCAAPGNEKETAGALLGGLTGALAASHIGKGSGKVAATALGAMLGVVVGSEIGAKLDEIDKLKAQNAFEQATQAPIGQNISWNNPETGNYGNVVAIRDGQKEDGEYCREFQTEVTVAGENQHAYGIACRKPDGSWKILG